MFWNRFLSWWVFFLQFLDFEIWSILYSTVVNSELGTSLSNSHSFFQTKFTVTLQNSPWFNLCFSENKEIDTVSQNPVTKFWLKKMHFNPGQYNGERLSLLRAKHCSKLCFDLISFSQKTKEMFAFPLHNLFIS